MQNDITSRVLQLVASETGVDAAELQDETEFTAMGVDSLLALTIAGDLREILELDVQSVTDCPRSRI